MDRVSDLTIYDTQVARYPELKVGFEAYGRNDISAGQTASQVVTNRKTIINHLLGLLDIVFVESIKPSDYGSNTVAYNLRAVDANAQLKLFCANHPRLFFVDTYSKTGDENGFDAGNSHDDVHLGGQGAWRASDAYMEIVPLIVGYGKDFSTDQNTLVTNPDLSGTGGSTGTGVTGDVADDWELVSFGSATGITVTASKTAEGNQRIVMSSTALATADQYVYFKEEITSGFEAGQAYRAKLKIKVNSGTRLFWAGTEIIQRASGSTVFTSSDLHRRDAGALLDCDDMAGEILTLQPMDVIIESTTDEIEFRVAFAAASNMAVSGFDVEVIECVLEEVDLNVVQYFGEALEFYFDPDNPNAYAYDPATNLVDRIIDSSWNGNDAVLFNDGFDDTTGAEYKPAGLDGLPCIFNNTDDYVGYKFSHSLTLSDPRTIVCVGKGDTTDADAGSASNTLFSAGDNSDTSKAVGSVRQVKTNHSQHQLIMNGYGSSYSDITDEAHVYWGRDDGTNVDGGYDKAVTEGPSARDVTGLTQSSEGYIFTDTGSFTRAYSGWGRHMMLLKGAMSDTQVLAAIYYCTQKNAAAL